MIHNEENSGFAKGNNIGVRFVNNHFDVDYLLISNNDIVFQQDDVVEKLIDKLNELDTEGVEPMSHVFPVQNVFREDEVVNGDDRENMLRNAPQKKEGTYMVPKTFA